MHFYIYSNKTATYPLIIHSQQTDLFHFEAIVKLLSSLAFMKLSDILFHSHHEGDNMDTHVNYLDKNVIHIQYENKFYDFSFVEMHLGWWSYMLASIFYCQHLYLMIYPYC